MVAIIRSAKGTFSGELDAVVRWQMEHQAALATVEIDGVVVDVDLVWFGDDDDDAAYSAGKILELRAEEVARREANSRQEWWEEKAAQLQGRLERDLAGLDVEVAVRVHDENDFVTVTLGDGARRSGAAWGAIQSLVVLACEAENLKFIDADGTHVGALDGRVLAGEWQQWGRA